MQKLSWPIKGLNELLRYLQFNDKYFEKINADMIQYVNHCQDASIKKFQGHIDVLLQILLGVVYRLNSAIPLKETCTITHTLSNTNATSTTTLWPLCVIRIIRLKFPFNIKSLYTFITIPLNWFAVRPCHRQHRLHIHEQVEHYTVYPVLRKCLWTQFLWK